MNDKQSNPANVFVSTIREVFQKPRYVALALVSAAVIGAGIVWLSGHQLIRFAFTSDIFDWSAKFKILWTSLGLYATNFTLSSQIMIVLFALMSGINIAMLVFYFKRRMAVGSAAGASGFGLIVGTLGVGCSACGSVILSSLIGITAASTLVSVLPLRGAEFGIASIALIGLSTYWLAKKNTSTLGLRNKTSGKITNKITHSIMKHLKITKILVAVMALGVGGFLSPQIANACGGQTASMGSVDDKLVAWAHADGNPRAMDYKANVQPAEVFIPPALADAIAKKYVSTYYPNAEAVDFHAFLFEHGSYVYMYDITDSSIRNRSTVTACGSNPQKSESNSMDIHIDAVTGDVLDGQGCGGGPSKVVMRYNANDYPAGLTTQTKNLTQFHSEFVIPIDGETTATDHNDDDDHAQKNDDQDIQSHAVTVDGRIDTEEWGNAASLRLEQYGKIIDIKSEISDGKLYWAIEADTKNWLALLLKTSPHHGMVWEFTDAKLLSKNGVEDYHVAYKGMMVGAGLEKDGSSTILAQATGETDNGRIYEFSMPLQSGPEGVDFQIGEYGNMAFYFGSTETFSGQLVYDDAFSKQMMMHVGKEIHRSVISSIIPETIATAYASADGNTENSGSSNQKVNLALLIIAIGGVVIIAFRKRLKKLIKQ